MSSRVARQKVVQKNHHRFVLEASSRLLFNGGHRHRSHLHNSPSQLNSNHRPSSIHPHLAPSSTSSQKTPAQQPYHRFVPRVPSHHQRHPPITSSTPHTEAPVQKSHPSQSHLFLPAQLHEEVGLDIIMSPSVNGSGGGLAWYVC